MNMEAEGTQIEWGSASFFSDFPL